MKQHFLSGLDLIRHDCQSSSLRTTVNSLPAHPLPLLPHAPLLTTKRHFLGGRNPPLSLFLLCQCPPLPASPTPPSPHAPLLTTERQFLGGLAPDVQVTLAMPYLSPQAVVSRQVEPSLPLPPLLTTSQQFSGGL